MKKYSIYLLTTVIVPLFLFISAYSQEDMTVVDNSVFKNPQRAPSLFKHDEHNEAAEIEDCNECHHIYENGNKVEDESSEDQRCSECHGKENSSNNFALMKAFHKNCKGCHLLQKKGPITCGECHRR